jgi:transcriptional regulator with XRE-family HTH domain
MATKMVVNSQMMKRRKQVAERITNKRQENEMSQGALAKRAGVDRKTINRIENGHFSPSMDTFLRIAIALNTDPREFLK